MILTINLSNRESKEKGSHQSHRVAVVIEKIS